LLASFLLPPVAARASLTTVGQISVAGTTLLDPEAVIAAANIPIGSSLLGVNLREAEEAVAALPLVASPLAPCCSHRSFCRQLLHVPA